MDLKDIHIDFRIKNNEIIYDIYILKKSNSIVIKKYVKNKEEKYINKEDIFFLLNYQKQFLKKNLFNSYKIYSLYNKNLYEWQHTNFKENTRLKSKFILNKDNYDESNEKNTLFDKIYFFLFFIIASTLFIILNIFINIIKVDYIYASIVFIFLYFSFYFFKYISYIKVFNIFKEIILNISCKSKFLDKDFVFEIFFLYIVLIYILLIKNKFGLELLYFYILFSILYIILLNKYNKLDNTKIDKIFNKYKIFFGILFIYILK